MVTASSLVKEARNLIVGTNRACSNKRSGKKEYGMEWPNQ